MRGCLLWILQFREHWARDEAWVVLWKLLEHFRCRSGLIESTPCISVLVRRPFAFLIKIYFYNGSKLAFIRTNIALSNMTRKKIRNSNFGFNIVIKHQSPSLLPEYRSYPIQSHSHPLLPYNKGNKTKDQIYALNLKQFLEPVSLSETQQDKSHITKKSEKYEPGGIRIGWEERSR